MSKNNLGLVEYAKSKLELPTIYMLSGFGRKLTSAMVTNRVENVKCPHTIRNEARIRQGIGRYCFDCVGIIKGYLWETSPGNVLYNVPPGSDQNVGMMYRASKEKGPLNTIPDIPGLLVFTADMGHVGIYIGKENGINQYIESTPSWSAWGVTTSAAKNHPTGHNRTWAYWGKYHLIDYIEPEVTPTEPVVIPPEPVAEPVPEPVVTPVVPIIPKPLEQDEPIEMWDRVRIVGTHFPNGLLIPEFIKNRFFVVISPQRYDKQGPKVKLRGLNEWIYIKDLKKIT